MRTRGFTLIELMISMALFGLIAAGAMALVMAGARSQAHSARVDVAQNSLRSGIDFITRDVMMLAGGARGGTINYMGTPTPAVNFLATQNNTGPNGSDVLDMLLVDGTVSSEIIGTVATGATSLSVIYEQPSITRLFPTSWTGNYYVQLSDLTNASVVQASAITNVGTTSATITVSAVPANTFAGNSIFVLPSRHVVYAVSTSLFTVAAGAQANTSMLTMNLNGNGVQPLAEGVEDMQVAYGFDTNADNIVTETAVGSRAANDDEWLYNYPGDTVQANMTIANLRTIRVTLVAKSTSVDTGATFNGIPKYEDRSAATIGDSYIRRVLTTEIAVRNLN